MTTKTYKWGPISDLPQDWQSMSREDLQEIHSQWLKEKAILQDPTKINQLENRLANEWAIETGIIERLYAPLDRGVTETLIELGIEALERYSSRGTVAPNVAKLIEDQRATLELLFDFVRQDRELTDSYIKQLHQALTIHQDFTDAVDQFGTSFKATLLKGTWKTQHNNPTRPDGEIHEYCPPEFVQDEIDNLVKWHRRHTELKVLPEVEAAWLHHRFTQIHPFQDGNGRVARALATLVFLRADYLPLVVRDEPHHGVYLDALEEADRGDLLKLVHLFADIQIADLTGAISFVRTLRGEGLIRLASSAAERAKSRQEEQRQKSQELTEKLLSIAENRLREAREELRQQFEAQRVNLDRFVDQNVIDNESWWTGDILKVAQNHGYRVDLTKSRRWVRLRLRLPEFGSSWTHIIISFHSREAVSGLLMANALLTTTGAAESEEGWNLEFVVDQPFTYSVTRREPEHGFSEWLNKAIQTALDYWQSRI